MRRSRAVCDRLARVSRPSVRGDGLRPGDRRRGRRERGAHAAPGSRAEVADAGSRGAHRRSARAARPARGGRAAVRARRSRLARGRAGAEEPRALPRRSRSQDSDEAVAIAEKAASERHDIFTEDALAWAYFKAGRLDAAKKAIALAPSPARATRHSRARGRDRRGGAAGRRQDEVGRLPSSPSALRRGGASGRRAHEIGKTQATALIRRRRLSVDVVVDPDALLTKLEVFGGGRCLSRDVSRAERDRRIARARACVLSTAS